jgi:hypothetical protein
VIAPCGKVIVFVTTTWGFILLMIALRSSRGARLRRTTPSPERTRPTEPRLADVTHQSQGCPATVTGMPASASRSFSGPSPGSATRTSADWAVSDLAASNRLDSAPCTPALCEISSTRRQVIVSATSRRLDVHWSRTLWYRSPRSLRPARSRAASIMASTTATIRRGSRSRTDVPRARWARRRFR